MYCSQLALQPQQGMQHCPPRDLRAQEAFYREAHKGSHLTTLRRHKQNNNSTSKGHPCNLFLQWLRVFLYVMLLCLLPFFWKWCLFISVCVDIVYKWSHIIMHFCWELVTAVCKGCAGCTLRYSRAIKSTTISHISFTRRCLYIVITSHSAIWPLKGMLLFLREMLVSNSLQCIGTVFHMLSFRKEKGL